MSWEWEWGFSPQEIRDILWLLRNGQPGPTLKSRTRARWRRLSAKTRHAIETAHEVK